MVVTEGPFDVDTALEGGAEEVKWLPGPVSSLGLGAVKGSRRYLVAWNAVSTSSDIDRHALIIKVRILVII